MPAGLGEGEGTSGRLVLEYGEPLKHLHPPQICPVPSRLRHLPRGRYAALQGDRHQARGPLWLCWPPGCEMPCSAFAVFGSEPSVARSDRETMPTRRLLRFMTGRRRI